MALRASSTGRSSSRTRPITTSSSLSRPGLVLGVIVNSNAPPPRLTLTAPRCDGRRSPPASAVKEGGSRAAKLESMRPKSTRLSGTKRHICEFTRFTSMPCWSKQMRSCARAEAAARARPGSSTSAHRARSVPRQSARKYSADFGAFSGRISMRKGADGARATLSSSVTSVPAALAGSTTLLAAAAAAAPRSARRVGSVGAAAIPGAAMRCLTLSRDAARLEIAAARMNARMFATLVQSCCSSGS
mmetsp:Transcript_19930/g.56639  ORF Transcript_19930/g.56639 Transcript_19930/m.56639 type:complete len:245 (-) Transcript_19930:77-811(-)